MIDYSLIIPFFNEEKNIPLVIKRIKKIYKKSKNLEFILVNNGSNDNSEIVFKKNLNKKDKRIKYFKIKKNIGYGYGIKYGLKKSKGKYIGWTHSDMQTDPIDILKSACDQANQLKMQQRVSKNNRPRDQMVVHPNL